ncbi:uncharacterized protein LOC125233393 [Leguminivora glycinivorella]|uniref:uncharacterized protein LOC125233393 n=1 Tax=Leguminivora glycinivorella TaxID=1035111 RepID=UPI00200E0B46|nr:uncharacterized protein LOC125233393 [Leguminivora glycinivorella]
MGSKWTDESEVLRDLSFAQGRWVPGGIDSAVAGANPPAHNITEETEEEYYQRWTSMDPGGGDFSSGPDLYQIKTMLELMQDEGPPIEEDFSGPIEIRKLNMPATHIPKTKNTKENKPPNKPRRARNVAIASIMALALTQEPLKLVKPEDFIKPSKEEEEIRERRKDSVNKVTNWLQSQDITCMFKRKSSVNSFKEDQRSSKDKSPVNSSDSVKSPVEASTKSPNGQYTPTLWAEEYYRKAVDRSHVRALVREDVWGRAERVMKEIDARKEELRKQQAEAELAAEIARQCEALEATRLATPNADRNENTSTPVEEDDDGAEGIAKVLLSASRHELYPGAPCVVCQVLSAPPDQDSSSSM